MIRGLMASCLALMLGVAAQAQEKFAGKMSVEDTGAFSDEGKAKAIELFEGSDFKVATQLTVVVFRSIPDRLRGEYARVQGSNTDKNRFFANWANSEAKDRNAEGTFVLISKEGGVTQVITDEKTDAGRGFSDSKLSELKSIIVKGFREATDLTGEAATQRRDKALLDVTQDVIDELKDTTVSTAKNRVTSNQSENAGGGRSIMGWVCIGLCVVVVVWVIIGLFRAMSGGGGYGGGGMGGGGGFFPSMMGGMFGAMAGMYLYDQFSGHDSASDNMSSDGGTDDGNYDDGAGDYDRGGDAGSGDDGGGDYGGGDWGGGGGDDFGGGGDFGGGDW